MAAGYNNLSADVRNRVTEFANNFMNLMKRSQNLLERLNDFNTSDIATAYNNVSADIAAYENFVKAVGLILEYATTTATTEITLTDHTTDGQTSSMNVPAGSFGLVTSDPRFVALCQSFFLDKSAPIRTQAPLVSI